MRTPIQPRRATPNWRSCATTSRARLDGNGKADADAAARRREDRGIDADDIAVHVEQRTAGIAAIDRRVGLDEIVIGPGIDVAVARRDDARRHGRAEAEGIADRDHPVADAGLVAVAEMGGGQAASWASTLSSARSVLLSRPTILAGRLVPSFRVTVIWSLSSIT